MNKRPTARKGIQPMQKKLHCVEGKWEAARSLAEGEGCTKEKLLLNGGVRKEIFRNIRKDCAEGKHTKEIYGGEKEEKQTVGREERGS